MYLAIREKESQFFSNQLENRLEIIKIKIASYSTLYKKNKKFNSSKLYLCFLILNHKIIIFCDLHI